MTTILLPVACPRCGERQNRLSPGFDPERKPFGGASCMVCGHEFREPEFLRGLAKASAEFEGRRARGPRPSARPRLI